MSALVLDCSLAMAWCFEDEASPEADAVLERVRDNGAIVPALWFWEVANVLTLAARRGRIATGDVAARLGLLAALPIRADDDGVGRAWRETALLAQAEALTVYDAAYLELALRLGGDLATLDTDVRRAADRLGVKALP
jgi:predicted nucleic acid-binding protein